MNINDIIEKNKVKRTNLKKLINIISKNGGFCKIKSKGYPLKNILGKNKYPTYDTVLEFLYFLKRKNSLSKKIGYDGGITQSLYLSIEKNKSIKLTKTISEKKIGEIIFSEVLKKSRDSFQRKLGRNLKKMAEISYLNISEEYRQRGFSRKLFKNALSSLISNEFDSVFLFVSTSSEIREKLTAMYINELKNAGYSVYVENSLIVGFTI